MLIVNAHLEVIEYEDTRGLQIRVCATATPDHLLRGLEAADEGPYPRILDTGCDYAAVGSVVARRAS